MNTGTTPGRRVYLPAGEVAAVCGLSEYVLENRYRPSDWASPRDFVVNAHGSVFYALDRLPALADALQREGLGLTDAAVALRAWAAPKLAAALEQSLAQGSSEDVGVHVPGRAGSTPAPASNSAPESWAQKWEREHDGL